MSKETLGILANREVIDIDQDPLGKQPTRLSAADEVEIYTRPLAGGAIAVAIFNAANTYHRPVDSQRLS